MIINPVGSSVSAYAEEARGDEVDYDDQIMATADSGVTISFSPTSGSASLTPTTLDGASARVDVAANVKIASTGGYTIYLSGKNAALTGSKTGAAIPGAATPTTFNEMQTNTWGFAYTEGTTILDALTYSALPQGQGKVLASVSGNQKNVEKSYVLSFATKIGIDKPADVYENQITLSVTSSPLQMALTNIADMQEMTTDICEASFTGDTKQLRDTRDGKYYWVTKLADGKCWMTQNLDLDLSTSKALTPADSDVASNWTSGFTTANQATSSTILASVTGQRTWSLGDYRILKPTVSSDCGYPKNSAANCTTQFAAYTTPITANGDINAHYILGNHYQWNAATAGTGGTITTGQATSSVCPKGWKLPTSGSNGDFQKLTSIYGIGLDTAKLTSAPLYSVRGGYVDQAANSLFRLAGDAGGYWSSMPVGSSSSGSYILYFYSANFVYPSGDSTQRYVGYSVRCVAR